MNKMLNISTLTNFDLESPLECHQLNILACVYSIILVVSLVINCIILWAEFSGGKDPKRSLHWLIITHTILNILGTTLELPFLIATNISCKLDELEFFLY